MRRAACAIVVLVAACSDPPMAPPDASPLDSGFDAGVWPDATPIADAAPLDSTAVVTCAEHPEVVSEVRTYGGPGAEVVALGDGRLAFVDPRHPYTGAPGFSVALVAPEGGGLRLGGRTDFDLPAVSPPAYLGGTRFAAFERAGRLLVFRVEGERVELEGATAGAVTAPGTRAVSLATGLFWCAGDRLAAADVVERVTPRERAAVALGAACESLAVDRGRGLIFAGTADGVVVLALDVRGDARVQRRLLSGERVRALATDGRALAAATGRSEIVILGPAGTSTLARIRHPLSASVPWLAMTADRALHALVIGPDGARVLAYDLTDPSQPAGDAEAPASASDGLVAGSAVVVATSDRTSARVFAYSRVGYRALTAPDHGEMRTLIREDLRVRALASSAIRTFEPVGPAPVLTAGGVVAERIELATLGDDGRSPTYVVEAAMRPHAGALSWVDVRDASRVVSLGTRSFRDGDERALVTDLRRLFALKRVVVPGGPAALEVETYDLGPERPGNAALRTPAITRLTTLVVPDASAAVGSAFAGTAGRLAAAFWWTPGTAESPASQLFVLDGNTRVADTLLAYRAAELGVSGDAVVVLERSPSRRPVLHALHVEGATLVEDGALPDLDATALAGYDGHTAWVATSTGVTYVRTTRGAPPSRSAALTLPADITGMTELGRALLFTSPTRLFITRPPCED